MTLPVMVIFYTIVTEAKYRKEVLMKDKKSKTIDCIQNIKSLQQEEDKLTDNLINIINSNQPEIVEDEISRNYGPPLARCEGCTHWDGFACDIIYYGCQFELKQ